jgi:hypothetical protein
MGPTDSRRCAFARPTSGRGRRGGWRATAAAGLIALAAIPGVDSTVTDTAEVDITSSVMLPAVGQTELLPAPAHPVRAGEYLKFAVNWGVINGGNAYLEVPEVTDWNGHEVYRLVARAESNAFISRIYKVRNVIESFWDHDAHFSRRYSEDRREGKDEKREGITFDHERQLARYDNGEVLPVPPNVQDALSSFYYTRHQALPVGGSIVFDYHAARKSRPLEVKVIGRERVKVPAGEFDCVVVEPVLKAGGVFKNKGRLVIWLTNDDRRLPVQMKSKVSIGSVSVVLEEYRAGAG